MSTALKNVKTRTVAPVRTIQTVQARTDQVANNAGGFTFTLTPKARLERFLILGVDGGTYYQQEQELTKENVAYITGLAKTNPKLLVDTVVEVSTSGRAYKNSPAIFALAVAINNVAPEYKALVRAAVPQVARTATMLFEFAQYVENLGGWGRAKRGAVADWYTSKDAGELAYQAVKYRQRNGWTHRDLLRLSHPQGINQEVGNFILGKPFPGEAPAGTPTILQGFAEMQAATSAKEVIRVLGQHKNLPWETIPTQFLTDASVWTTLFYNNALGATALLRNLKRFSEIGAFKDLNFVSDVADALTDPEKITKGRLHPMNYLVAGQVFSEGTYRQVDTWGSAQWNPATWDKPARIVDALDAGFYAAFGNIEPSGKRTLIGLDVSASMASPVFGLQGVTAAKAAAAMAMVTARTEKRYDIKGFTSKDGRWHNGTTQLTDLGITPRQSLATIMKNTADKNFGRTDCALPMVWAKEQGLDFDTFIVYTDNETYAPNVHPYQALRDYRQARGIDAKLVVVGMTSTEFTIADPKDAGMLDVVGMDTTAPQVIADFARV